ncbi:MAG: universal stress protein [Candidatus Omnitrophica bacterium]|nr:universal stress protein [Candidatus Omnitrophota bacterium]MBI2174187.1 universal stress protein [Candidatus Omnitrophota bacterium]MBI3009530.1 universal stress protein [Candidatus Omnitrophota bacterium]
MANRQTIDFSEPPSSRVTVLDRGNLHRVLNTPQLFAIGYGDVGSSIYYALGVTTLYALGAVPLALALAGVVFFCTVLTYTELTTAMPESGGSCSFARHAFNDLVSFIAGWALLLDYIVTIAISAYSIGPYLSNFIPALKSSVGNVPFTLGILGVLLGLNVLGIKESTRVSLLLCIFDIATQLAIIGLGLVLLMQIAQPAQFFEHLQQLWNHMQIGVPGMASSPTWPQFWKGVGMAMVAYIGIESISQLAGEARHPDKTLPRATISTMITLFVLYFGVSTIALTALTPQELTTGYLEDPIAGIAASMPFGREYLAPWVGLLGATILFVAANAGLIGASRLTFAMSEHFTLPRLFYRLHPRFKTPYVSLIAFTLIAGLIVMGARNLTHIAELYNFGAMLSFALAHLSLLGLRVRQPGLPRPFKIGWNIHIGRFELPFTALLGFLGTTAVWVDVIFTKPAGRNLGFLWMGVGLLSYFWYRHQQKLPAAARLQIERLQVPGYQPVSVQKILVPITSAHTNDVMQFAAKLAKTHGAEVTALTVIEIPPTLPLDTFFPEKLAIADSLMEQAQAIGREYELPVDAQVKQARFAGETIVEIAKEGNYDLVILAARPRPAAPGLGLFGTTVDYVTRNSPGRVWVMSGSSETASPLSPPQNPAS